jgi:nucleotide-binding universal stress UspA family protein
MTANDPGFRPRPERPAPVPAVDPTEAPGDPVEHLWNAAHEFLAAARAVIDAADAVVVDQQRRAATPRAPRLRRIDVE